MTGVEAVSNGVPAFRPPEPRNAASTMVMMAVLSITMFVGITLLAQAYHVVPSERETIVSQVARGVFSGRGLPYYLIQAATMFVLVLAANTAYADFPRLASILARDGYLPRQLMHQGDRLAFSNGIIGLSLFAGALIVIYGGDTDALIPLYMIGVFVSFTLSQSGMVAHWRRLRGHRWRTSAVINGLGAVVTGLVLIVVAITKSAEGAWIIIVLIPLHVLLFRATRRHYSRVAAQLSLDGWNRSAAPRHNIVILPIGGVHRAVIQALDYARTIATDVRAVYVNASGDPSDRIREEWQRWAGNVPLTVLESPYRSLLGPLLDYTAHVARQPDQFVTVVLPEFVAARWWQNLFHNQQALVIKAALFLKPGIVVVGVPYHLHS